jgi:hypothetical protein
MDIQAPKEASNPKENKVPIQFQHEISKEFFFWVDNFRPD